MSKLTEEQLALMTPDEREGYEEMLAEDFGGDDTNEDLDLDDDLNAGTEDEENENGDSAGEEGTHQIGDGDRSETDKPDNTAADEVTTAEDDGVTDTNEQPDPVMPSLDEVTGKLKTVSEQKDALAEQFDDGDLTAKEYRQKLKELDDQEWDLRKQELNIENQRNSIKTDQEELKSTWFGTTVPNFLKEHTQYANGGAAAAALDAEVRRLQAESKSFAASLLPDILHQAHKNISEAFGVPVTQAGQKKDDPKPKRVLPPSLASMPAADIADTDNDDGGAGAALDQLMDKDPEKWEQALAKLPEAEREKYLRRAG